MEMGAATPPAKKRRSEPPEGQKSERSPELSVAAPDSSPTTNPGEPPAEEGGGGDDCVSGLPDAILGDIISLLPTKDAARTRLLASRWRHIWRTAPLNLDHTDLTVADEAFAVANEALAGVVSRILDAHLGPGRRFCVPAHHIYDRPDTVDAWLRSPALDGLQELDFWDRRPEVFRPATPPASAFRFSGTLRVATFSNVRLLDSSVEGLHFPLLKQLALVNVNISEPSLHTMMSSCPVLECLLLNRSFGFQCVQISSNSLRSIAIGAGSYGRKPILRTLSIVDAPCLERLLYLQDRMDLHVFVISSPKLSTLGCFSDRTNQPRLVFGTTAIQGLDVLNLTTAVHSVKVLALNSWYTNLDNVVDLMKCFPCMEKLYIKSCVSRKNNRWRRKHKHFIRSFDMRLKTIVLQSYRGIRSEVNFVSFFILNARELETMRLVVDRGDYRESFIAQQHGMLEMEKRASRGAQLDFTTDRCEHDLRHVNHVRDLSITDPFQCRC